MDARDANYLDRCDETTILPSQFFERSLLDLAERKLWSAVVAQAIEDVILFRHAKSNLKLRLYWQAFNWLIAEGSDCATLCSWLGIDHEGLVRRAKEGLLKLPGREMTKPTRVRLGRSGNRVFPQKLASRSRAHSADTDSTESFVAEIHRLRSSESPANWAPKKRNGGPRPNFRGEPSTS